MLRTKKSCQCTEIVPHRDKGKAKKEAEYPSKLCHQWGAWVDQLLSLDLGLVRDGPEGKYWMLRFEGWRIRFSQETVFLVFARFPAPSDLKDFLRLRDFQLGKDQFIFPAEQSKYILMKLLNLNWCAEAQGDVLGSLQMSHLVLHPTWSRNPTSSFFFYTERKLCCFLFYLGTDASPQAWLEIVAWIIVARSWRKIQLFHFCLIVPFCSTSLCPFLLWISSL